MNSDQESASHGRWIEIEFDCLPLRTVARTDAPVDASPKLAAKMQRIKDALEKHGAHNSYYLHNAACVFHLTNDPEQGMMKYRLEGVVLTDESDLHARICDLKIELERETCSWLNQSIVDWLGETVERAVMVEFDRYIQAGDLSKTLKRIQEMQQAADESGGYVGMYL